MDKEINEAGADISAASTTTNPLTDNINRPQFKTIFLSVSAIDEELFAFLLFTMSNEAESKKWPNVVVISEDQVFVGPMCPARQKSNPR